ncbi:multifunctional oxoglutarate decarboxylase/oxoglutarate dehydrogenase thiamine pyrophosphate-binding subunit/dihydrolipoyllysine-residue succinyltransferase subunit [Cellulomonas fengjieae]|uniref:Multifunctional oxoglutarate decarboxylase/oxoglutarate dehydrogenase thiamine pyrophosphate-binding subunit/dihydrolipoyllysine-residue succinyltransferase subunit n=1 Tax=Cellulomonas fengjieae TaxID=2819978 RepID=A0ABS3SGC8_9CELL|nr:multifunctional oxoglutarate decarboxylase/oxoglutarate dehydrogenase thiamine pyrophosphate-binding subunit/dihydrolipoyllysine-residue succinyltransferase subunit [Cellulomonas fengjieae]MBO3084787.1 multifunctional oxoglutarate decarboxylase/oxoglutarate dehydrogenase thiamine pyrophosphate-binding subunit/dihydrolipoyllysine-residue succinyltransferase subunit [Cellulomonas fengjieae]QVI66896.1 multifunctional oxoglutarate decarboxylase/oxoglutarate dehydrogenase thiamine pyrophosphate-bin
MADPDSTRAVFGANEWLVDELFEQYQEDKNSVDPAWWDFFEGYKPEEGLTNGASSPKASAPTKAPANGTPVAPAPAKQAPAVEAPAAPAPAAPAPAAPAPAAPVAKETAPPTPAAPEVEPAALTAPIATAQPATAPYAQVAQRASAVDEAETTDDVQKLRGPAARVVTNMEASLEVPTATSVRAVPAKLMVDNRIVINNHLARGRGGKISFTHLIGFALVEALADMPAMNTSYTVVDDKPSVLTPAHVNLGIAIDLAKPDGTRQLLVPSIKKCETLDFAGFWSAYEDVVRRARGNKLTVEDFAGTTISLTNPGTIGTVHSVPRLMQAQGTIIGVGAMDYPAEFAGTSEDALNKMGISKVLTLTSTYDHRIIQGAQSGDLLRIIARKLLGEDGFYDRVFASLRVPYEPVRWVREAADPDAEAIKPARIAELIHSYRSRGHLMADTDPLAYRQRKHPDLDVQTHGLTLWDLDRTFPTGGFGGKPRAKLREVLGLLRDSYCRTVGSEYMHLQDPRQRRWLQERLEAGFARTPREEQLRILRRLNAAEAFETFLQTKYVGQKRFSLEGGESVIPLLDAILSRAADNGLDEVGIGMAHRGRLNILANIAGKSYAQIFREFEGNQDPKSVQGSGDVKYHLGTEGTFTAESGATTAVYLAANPSHLEAVDPVLEGIVRAKQDRIDLGGDGFSVLPILIHGDAAFAGQGVVFETLNLAQLRGYRTGGTIHLIINNQVGFTTGPSSSRSSQYATDVAKGLQVPIFHVNGDDPEACVRVAALAFEYREQFDRDVIIDMVCYRRRGHNEGDDPSMTQPLMYNLIEAKRSVRKLYTETLVARGDITIEEAEQALQDYQQQLERVFAETREDGYVPAPPEAEAVKGLERPESQLEDAGMMVGWKTAVDAGTLERIGRAHVRPPEGFTVHPKLAQLLAKREAMSREGGIDWGFGELLAFGSLLVEGTPVRLAGQDSRRGTFVQRHAVMHDRETGAEWTPLLYLSADQAKFWVYDSSLSEYAALGFEYGYSVERPDALVLWEAQFGDFVNGAQTIIDEFISSAEQKWAQRSSVVLLLPHGYEGQGPDHSSARIERFLQLAAEDNMTIAQPSTPASHFHLLRRQAYDRPRRPLVVFTPKSMLRLKSASSPVEDFTSGTFRTVIGDELAAPKADQVTRVLLCSGKVYWDLLAHRVKTGDEQTAIVRFEQLYPLDEEAVRAAVAPFDGAELVWVQDEPGNQGPWTFLSMHLPQLLDRTLRVVSRKESASPAAGSAKKHQAQQATLIEAAFAR